MRAVNMIPPNRQTAATLGATTPMIAKIPDDADNDEQHPGQQTKVVIEP